MRINRTNRCLFRLFILLVIYPARAFCLIHYHVYAPLFNILPCIFLILFSVGPSTQCYPQCALNGLTKITDIIIIIIIIDCFGKLRAVAGKPWN